MTSPAWNPTADTSEYRSYSDQFVYGELAPGDRIGRPLGNMRRKAVLRGCTLLLVLIGGGWALQQEPPPWARTLVSDATAMFASLTKPSPAVQPAVAAATAPVLPAIVDAPMKTTALDASSATREAAATARATASPEGRASTAGNAPEKIDELTPAAKSAEDIPGAPLKPPVVDPADPYQVKASAVGLHSDLSRVLLAKLSAADYRNAGIAIKTAIAETPDDGAYIWPKQRKPELALFKVHFVPGAPVQCRRYVVSIIKEGWLTTALPMEKCGVPVKTAKTAAPAAVPMRTTAEP
jgi:hypothetical protein